MECELKMFELASKRRQENVKMCYAYTDFEAMELGKLMIEINKIWSYLKKSNSLREKKREH